jgi:hypothetical protein
MMRAGNGVEFMKHTCISSKMTKEKPLMDDQNISPYVPETRWFHASNLRRMLNTYSTLYIKPDKGSGGHGIVRIRSKKDVEHLISYRQATKKCPTNKVLFEVKKLLHPQKRYIIQQGIALATYRQRPFDLRVVLQKPFRRWQLNWMSAKIAPRRTSIVTNIAQGAVDAKIVPTIQQADQSFNVSKVLADLRKVSFQIAEKLGAHFPFRVVGLDMGIDRSGKIWFIEANTRPDFRGLRKLDPKQYRRYLTAKKLIDSKRNR